MRRLRTTCTTAAAIAAVTATVVGCGGGAPGDLFVVQRSGSVPGAALTLRITNDGGAYCNSMGRREISSAQLIAARDIRRRLDGDEKADGFTADERHGLARLGLRLPPGAASIYAFRVRSEEGTITFHDSSRGQRTVPLLLALTRDVARGSCGLPR